MSGFQNDKETAAFHRVDGLANPGSATLPIGSLIQPEELKNYYYHDDHADYIEDVVAHMFLPHVYCAYQRFRQEAMLFPIIDWDGKKVVRGAASV